MTRRSLDDDDKLSAARQEHHDAFGNEGPYPYGISSNSIAAALEAAVKQGTPVADDFDWYADSPKDAAVRSVMAHLRVVPPTPPTRAERVRQRLKATPRPEGMLQCNRCGGRLVLTTEAGVIIRDGRRVAGTKIDKDVCAECWKRGIFSPMLPDVKAVP
jgi:hypothetical protein